MGLHVNTGQPTQSVGGQYCFALWCLLSSVTLHGGPVMLRPVRATPCYICEHKRREMGMKPFSIIELGIPIANATYHCSTAT